MATCMLDSSGAEIHIGDVVRQARVYDPAQGALYRNAGQTGTVVGFGRIRVKVDFGHQRDGESVVNSVHASLLTVASHIGASNE